MKTRLERELLEIIKQFRKENWSDELILATFRKVYNGLK